MKTTTNQYLATLLLTMAAQAAAGDRLIDPTRPANAAPVRAAAIAPPAVRLEAILESNGIRVAIVNGKIVRAGEQVGAARIEAILSNGIRYVRGGRTQTVHLGEQAMQVRQNVVPNEEET